MNQDFFQYPQGFDATSATPPNDAALPTILDELSEEDWDHLVDFAAQRSYSPGGRVIALGETTPALYLIVSGRVQLRRADDTGSERGEGECFGILSFLDDAPSMIEATALEALDVLRLDPEGLTRLAAWHPRIATRLLLDLGAHLAARLRRLQPGD
jgi:CRP/FNR family transcriptional regulator, cyclic AMP receptor protein